MGALRAPTVGRESELAALTSALDEVAGVGALRWLVVAPPGVGKSRLLREFATVAESRSRTAVWRARSRPVSVSPFETISELLTSALGSLGGERLHGALAAGGVPPSRAEVIERAFVRDPATDDRDALFAAWLDGLDVLAAGATQLWLVEDVHWA